MTSAIHSSSPGGRPPPSRELNDVQRQALDWVIRLTSGAATEADAEALRVWRETSAEHDIAFREAARVWHLVGDAAVQSQSARATVPARTLLSRRAWIGGALAASVAGLLAVRPPLRLWPSIGDAVANLEADYRTGIGEQQQIVLPAGVSLQMNTGTRIALLDGLLSGVELISGEAYLQADVARPFTALAGDGEIGFARAQLNIRHTGDVVHVSCAAGECIVRRADASVRLASNQQVSYGPDGLGTAHAVDAALVSAWRNGLLVFRDLPLAEVIDEVNRYRPGAIIVTNAALGERRVSGTFYLDRLDEVLSQMERAFGAQVRTLPGEIVLLS